MSDTARPRPKVVIIGGGFGGLEAVRALARAPVEITLIDRHNYHLFQPLLYQVATAALSPAEIAWPLRHILSDQRNARVLMAEASRIDAAGCVVHTDMGAYPYDFLIIATGANHSYFSHPEWEATAPGLKTVADATDIRQRVLLAFEKAETSPEKDRGALLTFVIVGGGPTGVEMAGAVAELAKEALGPDFRHIDPKSARVLLLEGSPRLLPALDEKMGAYAERTLKRRGVEVRTGALVTACNARGVRVGKTRIDAATVVWAAGIEASSLVAGFKGEHDRAGRLVVGGDMSLAGHPEIFVIGDAAAAKDHRGQPLPGIAPAAKQAGRYVGKVIAGRVKGEGELSPFDYRHFGDLATIGRDAAAVKLGPVHLSGFVGWVFWSAAHVYFLIGTRNRIAVAWDWAWSWLTRQRSVRLIIR